MSTWAVCANCGSENETHASLCRSCGADLSAQGSAKGDSRKVVTVLFSDVTGSTVLGEELDPESLRQLMARYFREMQAVVQRHEGTTEKFIGDAVMAVFGMPRLHEDDALRAVRAAVEMREALQRLNDEFERVWGVRILAHTGVNTGEVIVGDPPRGESFVVGDAVNVAARLEQAAEPGQILIGESTYRLVRDAVTADPLPPRAVKGKTGPVSAWSLLEVTPGAPGWSRRLDSPLVGRDRELGALEETFQRNATSRSCELVTMLGAAGVGKSRLANEFLARLGSGPRVVSGHCLPYGEGITFWPIVEVLRDAAGVSDADSPEAARSKILELLEPATNAQLIGERLTALLGLSGVTLGIQETFWAVRKFFEELAARRPLVVVFDDIQWGEPTFLDLLEYLADWIQGVPVMLLCLARGDLLDVRGAWMAGKPNTSLIMLHPLTRPQTEGLIGNLLGGAWPPDEALAQLAEVAEGNPLFAEEMLRMLVDDGRLRRDNGSWTITEDSSTVAIPPTIHALLTARLDRLDQEERAVIERASVVGRQFWWRAITELSPDEKRGGLGGRLQSLTRKELIRPDRSDLSEEDTFRFAHILICDAAYRGIPKAIRADLHERFADWLVEEFRDRAGEYEEIVGYHLEQAHRTLSELGPANERTKTLGRRAAVPLISAGRRAFARGDMPAASNLLSRVTSFLPEQDPERLRLLPMLGKALRETGQLGRADAVLTEGIDLGHAAGDRRVESLARIERASLRDYTNPSSDPDELRRVAEQSIAVFEEFGDDEGLAQASSLLAEVHWVHGHFAAMEALLERGLLHAQRANDQRGRSFLLAALARAALLGPTPVDAALRRCEEITAQAGDDRVLAAVVLPPAGGLHALRGDFERARSLYGRARASFEEFGLRAALAALPLYSGPIELLAGDPRAAERELRRGHDLLEEMGDRGRFSTVAAFLSQALYAQGRLEEADAVALSAAAAATADDFYTQAVWRGTRALILASAESFEQAERLAREAVALSRGTDWPNLAGDALLVLAEVLAAGGRTAEATARAGEALRRYRQKGNDISARRAEQLARLDRGKPQG
jgi:class 3 adenylate cyclase/tetratricopeptide (TPR) repeat protein